MPRIRVLPDAVVNRIAAGEVVERPASVVKELVENALDAEARRVEIELVNGGRSMVRVSDDGGGMDEDDALLALERHATSKLGTTDDLQHINTLGFRGEALPSIAAVSRFTLTTCADPQQGGLRLSVEGGRILGVEPRARSQGTTVEVADLFFNLPARRKFLHSPETELRHAQQTVTATSLARPDVAFVLRHGGRTLLEVPPVADMAGRLADLQRRRKAGEMTRRFEQAGGGVKVEGLMTSGSGSGRPTLVLLVNGRPVKDRLLTGAALRTLRESGPGLGGSMLVLEVVVEPDEVDVNVHPTKAEVRFARPGAVFAVVERALRSGVAAIRGTVDVRAVDALERPQEQPPSALGAFEPPQATTAPLFPHPAYDREGRLEANEPPAARQTRAPLQPHRPAERVAAEDRRSGARSQPPDTPFGRLIGQYRRSFLLLEDDQGLVIIDQHVAHERVLYDQIRRRLAGEAAPAQALLTPVLVEMDEAMAASLPRVQELLSRVGVEAELFGNDTVRLTALPAEVGPQPARELVAELLERATALDGVPERVAEQLQEELAASLSCRAAIKVNHELPADAQRALLRDLAASDNPYRCPHGRPIVIRLSHEEMERRLGRR